VAIVQVEGEKFSPLAVGPTAPVGSPVWVLSHPVGWLYTFTAGMVSGYTEWVREDGGWQTTWMTISADYAGGSSGAPVLNEHGAVVGIASRTKTLYSDERPPRPQMAIKLCMPATALLDLIQPQ
jgi:S1-C subfamily serine protease